MKVKDIGKQYKIDTDAFGAWIKSSGYTYKSGALGGVDVDDSQDIAAIVGEFNVFQAETNARNLENQRQEADRIAKEKAAADLAVEQKKQALASMLITSGFGFDGHTITKYSGYISGDDVVQIARGREGLFSSATDVGSSLMNSLVHIRRNALAELKEAAWALGCNAIIGVDFDYLTLDPETVSSGGGTLYLPYVFGVTANGNAVVIEQNKPTAL